MHPRLKGAWLAAECRRQSHELVWPRVGAVLDVVDADVVDAAQAGQRPEAVGAEGSLDTNRMGRG